MIISITIKLTVNVKGDMTTTRLSTVVVILTNLKLLLDLEL